MAETILINFTADAAGLQPGIDGLVQLNTVDRELADQAVKTGAALNKRNKDISDGNVKAKGSVEDLSNSFSKMDKSIMGGTFKKTFDDIRNNIQLTDKELKKFYENIVKNSRNEIITSTNQDDIKQLTALMEAANKELDNMDAAQQQAADSNARLTSQVRSAKDEMAKLTLEGKGNTVQFEELKLKADQYQRALTEINKEVQRASSHTFVLDAIVSSARGVAGGFEVAAAGAALFGDKNEDVEKALLKVNSAMALLNGLKEIQEFLSKESAASQAIDILLRRDQAVATVAQTVATEEETVAQEGLNTAMAANPIGIVLVAVTALITALSFLSDNEKQAAEDAKKLAEANKALQESFKMDEEIRITEFNKPIEALKSQLSLLQSNGASEDEILKKKIEIAQAQSKINVITQYGANGLQLVNDQLDASKQRVAELTSEFDKFVLAGPGALNKGEFEKGVERLSKGIELEKETYSKTYEILKSYYDNKNELDRLSAEQERTNFLNTLKSNAAFADAALANKKAIIIKNQVDSIRSIEAVTAAEKNAINERLTEALKSNPNLLPGERAKLIAEANLAILELDKKLNQHLQENRKQLIKAEVTLSKEGSLQEFEAKLKLMDAEKQTELQATEVTSAKKKEIDARYLKERNDLTKLYNKQVAEDAINGRIAEINAQLSGLQRANISATNSELIKAKEKLIEEQAALEVVGITYSEHNEELRREKIKAIYAKELADKQKLEDDRIKAEIERARDAKQDSLFFEKIDIEVEAIRTGSNKTKELRKIEMESIRADRREVDLLVMNGVITDEEAEKRKTEIEKREAALRLAIAKDEADKKTKIYDESAQILNNIVSIFTNADKARLAQQLSDTQGLYDAKFIGEKEYQNRMRQIKRQQAIDDKKKAIFDVIIQQGPVLLKAFKDGGLIGEIFASALFLSQLAAVSSTQLPQFRQGEVGINGPGTETSDSILARISKNESVISAAQTRKWKPALEAINDDKFESYMRDVAIPKFSPRISEEDEQLANRNEFDYQAMGKVIASELAENPMLLVKFDKDGMTTHIIEKGSITDIKNRDFEL